jgi:hypothetical protein
VGWGSYESDTIPPTKQIGSINTLTITYDISVGGSLVNFDVIYDFYLTPTPGPNTKLPGGGYNFLHEIEIALHR